MTPKLVFNLLKSLSLKNLLKLFLIGFSHPIFSILTFFATYKTYKISEKLFPKTHGLHGAGNAFRHALWNSLIMMYCCKVSSPKKALIWTEKITQMHEDLFPNEPLQRKMDFCIIIKWAVIILCNYYLRFTDSFLRPVFL